MRILDHEMIHRLSFLTVLLIQNLELRFLHLEIFHLMFCLGFVLTHISKCVTLSEDGADEEDVMYAQRHFFQVNNNFFAALAVSIFASVP